MQHILFLSYDGMTDPLGQSQVIPYLAGLTTHGYRFTILSCDKKEKYDSDKSAVENILKDLPIKWVSIPYHKSPPIVSSLYDLMMMKRKIRSLHKKDPFDMVHTRPGVPTLAALWMKKKFKVKFLNDIRGFWADERVDGGMWDLTKPVYRYVYKFFKKHEEECVEKADQVVCLTYAAEKIIQTWKHIPRQPIPLTVIPCSADLEFFNPRNINVTQRILRREQVKISPSEIIFSYLGSIGGWYLTHEMMELCKVLCDTIPNAKFLFISPHRHHEIKAAAANAGIPSEKISVTKASRAEVPVFLSFSHYSLFFIKPCYSKISSSPTKHGEIMSMGIPVITNAGVGDVADIVKKYDSGFIVDSFSREAYQKIADQIAAGKTFDKDHIRKGAFEFYSLDEAVRRYASVYKKIFS